MVIITQLAGNRARSSVQTRLLVQTVPERTMQMLATVKINSACLMVLLRVMLSKVYCTALPTSALAMIFFFFFAGWWSNLFVQLQKPCGCSICVNSLIDSQEETCKHQSVFFIEEYNHNSHIITIITYLLLKLRSFWFSQWQLGTSFQLRLVV